MAAETSHDTTHAVQPDGCCITGSLVGESSEELKTCEPPKDGTPQTGQEDQTKIDNPSSTDNAVEETKEVAILQDGQNEVGNQREDLEADERLYPTDTMTLFEDATPTKVVDNDITKEISKEERDGKVGVTVDDDRRQEEEVDDSSWNERNSEVDQNGNKDFIVDCSGLSGEESISIPKDESVDSAADDEIDVFEVDTKERRDSFDQTEAVEPCGSLSLEESEGILNKNLKENGGNGTADQDPTVQSEADASTSCPKGAIAQNIHQGELLLYRLHLVQQNQELQQVSDGPPASNTAAMVMTNETVNSVTLREGTEGDGDDLLSCRVENIQGNESQKEQNQVEVVDTSSAGTGEDSQVEMGKENIPRPLKETPIQREIRNGLEREKSLRRSRGLDDLENKFQELVEIPVTRSSEVPDQSLCANVGFNAEKRLAKRKMLQDINQEVMKEQAVKKLGKVPGLYDQGYAQELKERRMLFEAFHQCKKTDTQGSSRGRKLFSSSFTAKNAETPFVRSLERTRSLDFLTNYQFRYSTSPSTGRESHQNDIGSHRECQIKDLEDDANSASSHETQSVGKSLRPSISLSSLEGDPGTMPSVQDIEKEEDDCSVLKGKNPFFQLRPSLSLRPDVEKEIRQALEREEELRRMRSRLYGEQWNRPGEQLEGSTQSHSPESTSTVSTDHVYRGKLTLIWPPPRSKVEGEPGPPKPVGQRSTLQHYRETGMVNSSCSEKN